MKAILMSIRPQWVSKILNGEKTIEIRKRFPKDYVGWVYIYCTKGKDKLITFDNYLGSEITCGYDCTSNKKHIKYGANDILNGKVVARFWCDKVEEIKWDYGSSAKSKYVTRDLDEWELCDKSCLTGKEMTEYLGEENSGYAIHITKLEIFHKPKEISEFRKPSTLSLEQLREFGLPYTEETYKDMTAKGKWFITRAPRSGWCYVEV